MNMDLDRLLEAELGTFKQELKTQHMEQSLGMVQAANVLRKDVSLALQNERETRGAEVAELRQGLDAMHDNLLQEFHETMNLVGARLEQHLQDALNPESLQSLLSERLGMSRLLQKASNMQQ